MGPTFLAWGAVFLGGILGSIAAVIEAAFKGRL